MKNQQELWYELNPEITPESLINKVCLSISSDIKQLDLIVEGLLQNKESFNYQPLFGADILVSYDWKKLSVVVKSLNQIEELSLFQWINYLAKIDTIFSPILPNGSVIEIDGEKISKEVKEIFETDEPGLGFYLQVISRRATVENSNAYADYLTTIWPIGIQPLFQPIPISNYVIKSVINEGYKNTFEEKYTNALRLESIINQRHSILFDNLLEATKENES
ncbi:DUF4176 domain-containing protein [Lactobacillus sp. PV034]|uniref:DUF4176 domain-containing protein n=1 Tax=Lactobacillus sp. PV034 TaxID=2594495 RepID=UPI00224047AB|nr:DUF4176 domain-containing protein [Lactobacillus sp. PV034]